MNDTKLKTSSILRVEKLDVERMATSTRPFAKTGLESFISLSLAHAYTEAYY